MLRTAVLAPAEQDLFKFIELSNVYVCIYIQVQGIRSQKRQKTTCLLRRYRLSCSVADAESRAIQLLIEQQCFAIKVTGQRKYPRTPCSVWGTKYSVHIVLP